MKSISVIKAKENEIDWINTKYAEVDFVKSNYENEYIVIAKVDTENAGLGRLVIIDENNIELGGIYVFPNYNGLGVAQQIVRHLCDKNPLDKSLNVWCLPFEKLLNFYSKFGFKNCEKNIPRKVSEKLEWCNTNTKYDQKVLLLHKMNRQ